jgi:hypothetical protein
LKADYDYVPIQTKSGKHEKVSLIPDSYFVIQTQQGRAPFFLELDRGTMELSRFETKILAYQAYVISGMYEARYNSKSLCVMTVTLSEKRRDQLRKAVESVGGRERYWFGMLSDIAPDTVLASAIWSLCGQAGTFSLFLN